MHTSSRFAVAVHTLVFLAARNSEKDSITSDMIAQSVDTNPVVIRRILGILRESNLVTSQSGVNGGWYLNRKPDAISLCEIYRALESDPLFALPPRPGNANCEIGRNMQEVLNGYFKDAERAAESSLGKVTLAQVMNQVWSRAENEIGGR